jgi:hypothetical protein
MARQRRVETGLYSTPAEALKKLCADYDHWTGRFNETTVQMCYALIGANWVVFSSITRIRGSVWATLSMLSVILALLINHASAWYLSWAIRKRVNYGEADSTRWNDEFNDCVGKESSWPYTSSIDAIGTLARNLKGALTILAGLFLVAGVIAK